jgi:hypothetical protein
MGTSLHHSKGRAGTAASNSFASGQAQYILLLQAECSSLHTYFPAPCYAGKQQSGQAVQAPHSQSNEWSIHPHLLVNLPLLLLELCQRLGVLGGQGPPEPGVGLDAGHVNARVLHDQVKCSVNNMSLLGDVGHQTATPSVNSTMKMFWLRMQDMHIIRHARASYDMPATQDIGIK